MESKLCPSPKSPNRPSLGSKSSESLEETSPLNSTTMECTECPECPECPECSECPQYQECPECPSNVPSENGEEACNTEDKELALSISEELMEPTDPTISVSETFLEDMETIGSLDDLTEANSMTQEFPESMTEENSYDQRDDLTHQVPEESLTTESAVLALVESLETTGERTLGVLDVPATLEIPFTETLQPTGNIMDGPVLTTSEHQLYMECRKSVLMEPQGPLRTTELDSVSFCVCFMNIFISKQYVSYQFANVIL